MKPIYVSHPRTLDALGSNIRRNNILS